jgi:hypothetical protein
MKILLDENIPVQLKAVLHGYTVKSVNDKDVGWKNIKNGRLLIEMKGIYDLLITADKNIYAQQNLSGRDICILVLPTNRRKDVLALGSRIVEVVASMSIGEYVVLERTGAVQLKDPLIFRQCIHLRDIAVLLNRGSYVEQDDRRIEARLDAGEGRSELPRQCS